MYLCQKNNNKNEFVAISLEMTVIGKLFLKSVYF